MLKVLYGLPTIIFAAAPAGHSHVRVVVLVVVVEVLVVVEELVVVVVDVVEAFVEVVV